MTLKMKPFGWNVAVIDGSLSGINLGWWICHPNLISIAVSIFLLLLGTFQIYTLNTEEVNDTPTKL